MAGSFGDGGSAGTSGFGANAGVGGGVEGGVPDASGDAGLNANVEVFAGQSRPIHASLYGINNDWRKVSLGQFKAFSSQLKLLNYSLLRFPGGFESEWYDWQNNDTDGWPNAPATSGATPGLVLAHAPQVSFVVETRRALNETIGSAAAIKARSELATQAKDLVLAYGKQVRRWEIGNEWWNQSPKGVSKGDQGKKLERYAWVAREIVNQIRAADGAAKIYVTGRWEHPNDFQVLRDKMFAAWPKVSGVSLHVYAGDTDPTFNVSKIEQNIAAVRKATGLNEVYVSEWHASKAYTEDASNPTGKSHLKAANVMLQHLSAMLDAEVTAATIWPPVNGIPGLNLMNAKLTRFWPCGQAFKWAAESLRGRVWKASSSNIPIIAAAEADQIALLIMSKNLGAHELRIKVHGAAIHSLISAEALYTTGDANAALEAKVAKVDAQLYLPNNLVRVTVNAGAKGVKGRGSAWEIIRLLLKRGS